VNVYNQTLSFYDRKAPEYARIWGKADPHLRHFARKFVQYLPPESRRSVKVLDVGTGTARDVKMLPRRGYDAYGIDFSPATIELAKENNPTLRDKLFVRNITDLSDWYGRINGIWDNAVLHHISQNDLNAVLEQYKLTLSDYAPSILFLREKEGRGEKPIDTGEYQGEAGRFFHLFQEDELCDLVVRHSFEVLESGQKPDRRKVNMVWLFARLR
jgi:SAM-dependent methyltransferase